MDVVFYMLIIGCLVSQDVRNAVREILDYLDK